MVKAILHSIAEGKEWSWSVIGLLAIIGGLAIRGMLLRDILRGMKIRNRNWYHRTQEHYQGRAIIGWIFFILFAVGTMLLWRFEIFFLRYFTIVQWILILIGLFVASLFCHLRAYAKAIVEAVQENVAMDKDI